MPSLPLAPIQIALPQAYSELTEDAWRPRIEQAKQQLGNDLLILGHHYQRDEVITFADRTGDSLKLAQLAAQVKGAKHIVFCGVHFMAETADILTEPEQTVTLPDLNAGCSMADMADIIQVEDCYASVRDVFGGVTIPITYVNSSAKLKAFCGEHGGAVCTSSNAQNVLRWALTTADRALFFPDEHLGRNTAAELGLKELEMIVWNQLTNELEWLPGQTASDVRVVLWKGFCSVHQRFSTGQIADLRERFDDIRILVHPECAHEVVQAADLSGSTEFIIRSINEAAPGSTWAIGTEINLVHRLAKAHPEQQIFSLDPIVCPCSTMNRISPQHLAWTLDELVAGRVVNRITVPDDVAQAAKIALQRMLESA